MKPGDIVTIYQDPLTKQKVEGQAKLIEKIGDIDNLENWQVHFLSDDPQATYSRLITVNSG